MNCAYFKNRKLCKLFLQKWQIVVAIKQRAIKKESAFFEHSPFLLSGNFNSKKLFLCF